MMSLLVENQRPHQLETTVLTWLMCKYCCLLDNLYNIVCDNFNGISKNGLFYLFNVAYSVFCNVAVYVYDC